MKLFVTAAACALLASACTTVPEKPALTPMEIQAMQSREYPQSKEVVFQSVMSVFQDLGYTLNSADLQTGFLTASSAASTQGPSFAELMLVGAAQARQYTQQTRGTASVEAMGAGGTRVRLNFVVGSQASSGYGQQSAQDTPITDAQVYQNAFEKIETAIFMRAASSKVASAPAAGTPAN